MKLLILILLTCPAFGAITVVDTCTGTTSCTASGTHQPGDLAIYGSWRAASATAPTNPAGWTSPAGFTGSSATGASRSWRLGCRVLPSTASLASGTVTNATNMAMVIIRGSGATSTANCATDVIPTVGTANSVSSATATFSALTLSQSSSLPLLFMGSSTSGQTCMPATGTSKAATGDINIGVANATGNWSAGTCTITSSVTTEIVLEVTAPITLATCSTNCPTWVQYDQWGSTSNSSTPLPQNSYFNLTQAVLSNNLLAAAARWFDAGNTITATLTADGTTMTAGPTCNDASGTHIKVWYLPAATGKQHLKLALSAAAGSIGFMAVELRGVPTTTPVDGTSTCTAGTTGPYAQPGSITTTVANDFIWVPAFDNGDNVVLNTTNRYAAPYDNWNLLGANNAMGPASYYTVWGSTGAINPGMLAYQTTNDVWAVAAIAFKQSAGTGTAPTGMYVARNIVTIPTATTFVNQFPAAGNLAVAVVDTDNVQSSVSDLVDSDANGAGTLNGSASLGAGHYDRFNNGAGFPQGQYACNATVTNNNTRALTFTMANTNTNPFHVYDVVGALASSSCLDTGITSSDGTVAHGIITLTSTQTTKAVSSTACTNDPNSNSTVHFTPSTASGIGIIGEWNAGGPECGMSGTNNVFLSGWFEGENDSVAGNFESSSGNAVVPYSSAAAQAVVFNWANNLFASASGYGDFVMVFKAPAAAGCNHAITLFGMGCM